MTGEEADGQRDISDPINCYILSILSTIGVLILIILNDQGWGKYLAYIGSESGGKGE